jgi:DNA-binding NarL/FixJ family response regulator
MATARLLLEEAIDSIGAGQLRARATLCLGRILFDSDVTAAIAATTEALGTSGADRRLRTQALIDLAFAASNTADRGQARPHAEEAARLAASLDDADLRTQALSVLALCQTVDGEPAAAQTLAKALRLEERVPYLSPARGPGFVAGLRAVWSGDCDAARKQIGEVLQRAMDWGEHSSVPDLLVNLALAETQAGDWAAATEHALSAQRLAAAQGHVRVHASAIGALAMIAALRGDEPACQAAAESGLGLSAQAGAIAGVVGCTAALGLMYLGKGDFAGTDRQLGGLCDTFVIASYEPSVIAFVADEIEALTGLGKLAEAAAMLGQYENRARQLASRPALAAALRCRALMASASGDLPAALAAADEALSVQEALAQPFDLARTQLARGSVLRRARRWREARVALDAAIAGFDALGAAAWRAQARQQHARLGGRHPGREHLTAGEAQVVRLAAAGRTNKEIAAELYLSVRAVEKALTGSYRKLGVRSRTELAARLAREPGSGRR